MKAKVIAFLDKYAAGKVEDEREFLSGLQLLLDEGFLAMCEDLYKIGSTLLEQGRIKQKGRRG